MLVAPLTITHVLCQASKPGRIVTVAALYTSELSPGRTFSSASAPFRTVIAAGVPENAFLLSHAIVALAVHALGQRRMNMRVTDLRRETLKLAQLSASDAPVVSCYLDLRCGDTAGLWSRAASVRQRLRDSELRGFIDAMTRVDDFVSVGLQPDSQ